MKRKTGGYFRQAENAPEPLRFAVRHRARFSEVDAMAIVWHGRFLQFFEMAAEELCRRIGLSYREYYDANLRAPLVQAHVDFHAPVSLGEVVMVEASLLWNESARLNIEYKVAGRQERVAASGYTVQMFTDGTTGEPYLITPPLLAACRARWLRGEFKNL